ncbi:MFS transporter [Ureibacillus sp. GCM10028918]|uniref:MFS transporter n=1 Tax=Ureibacillus sp. GCM10028918 TaxID=3273429 RepID=UPI00361F5084
MFIFATLYSFQPLLPLLTEEFSISVTYASMTMSLTSLSLIAGLIVLGFLSDRKGRVLFIKLSILLSLLSILLIPFVDSYFTILLLRIIQGFTLAGVPAAALAYIAEEIETESRQLATALYISTNALGGMIGRIVTGYLSEQYNWQGALIIFAIFGAFVFIFVLFTLPKSNNFQPSVMSFKEDLKGFSYHLINPSLLLMFGLGVILQITFTGMWTYLPLHLSSPPFSLSMESISLTYFAYSFGIIGAPLASWLSKRYQLEKIRIIAILILVTGIICTLFDALFVVLFGLCITCFGFFTAHSLTAASVGQTAIHLKGSASSLYLVSYYIGIASGSTLIYPLWEVWNWNGMNVVTITLLILYLAFFYYALLKLNRKSRKE